MNDDGKAIATSEGPPELRPRLERLRALHSAWGVLAPAGLLAGGQPVAEIGALLSDHLSDLARRGCSEDALVSVDAGLDEFARMMRAVAFQVPIAQLRSTLPAQVGTDRRGVLDLLDLLLETEIEIDEAPDRVGAVDYVITLLCLGSTGEQRSVRHDPVTLTPRLHARCQRAEAVDDPRVPEIEGEFFAAAGMDEHGLRDELHLRTLRRRKSELGEIFFAPRVLRAIVTYNVTLMQRITNEVSASLEWGAVPENAANADDGESVFQTGALRSLAEAVRRRAGGGAPAASAVDRVAWCLDLDYPTAGEREALLAESVGSPLDPKGTAILLGLLCRSLVVLADELSGIGISADVLVSEWVPELDEIFKAENNRLLASDAYPEACALSELKNKYLYAPLTQGSRGSRPLRPAAPEPDGLRDEARKLAGDALSQRETAPTAPSQDGSPAPWGRALGIGAALLVAAVLGTNLLRTALDGDLARYNGNELERVSPYLSEGRRNGAGRGPAFVGTFDDDWFALDDAQRRNAALDLVASLRATGVREVMVYDDDGRLRLQLLGQQPLRLLP